MPDPLVSVFVVFEVCAALMCGVIMVEQMVLYWRGGLCTMGRRGRIPQNNAQARSGIWLCVATTAFHVTTAWYLWS
mgnify:CR=1 FL=1